MTTSSPAGNCPVDRNVRHKTMNDAVTIVCGDFESVLPTLEDECTQLVFTSPPYGVGMDYENDIRLSVLFSKLNVMFREAARITKRGGYVVVNFGDIIPARDILGTDEPCEMPMGWVYWSFGLGHGLVLQAQRVWKKNFAKITNGKHAISAPRPVPEAEHIYTFRKISGKPTEQKIRNRQIHQRAIWDTSEDAATGSKHPAAFPESLVARVIEIYTDTGDLVVDPFAGGGTVGVVAARMGRRAFLVEKEPGYCDEARERVSCVYLKDGQRLAGGNDNG